nr:TCP-1/cpn60 chaperonin family protein [Haladaptatus halobius]
MVDLRAANEDGQVGLVTSTGEAHIDDPVEHGILDPSITKWEVIHSATEVATMTVRINEVISAE